MSATEKRTRAFVLSLTAGILILMNAAAVAAAATWSPGIFPTLPGSSGNDPAILYSVAVVGLICGALIVLGAILLRSKPAHKRAWSIMIVVLSIPSVVTGGGFIIGFILGIMGGVLALSRKPEPDS
jgi:hypothetical protein